TLPVVSFPGRSVATMICCSASASAHQKPSRTLAGAGLGRRKNLTPAFLQAPGARAPPRRHRPDLPEPHRSRRDILRSASSFPPVWQVGQYCREESAKETSATVSPHTGQACPVRPCTRICPRLVSLS